jgi:hypothetical protein
LDTNRIAVEEFKNQNALRLSDDLILDSAKAYFSIPGRYITAVDYHPYFDSIKFSYYCGLLIPGAWVTFMVSVRDKVSNISSSVQLQYIIYSMVKMEKYASSPLILEWKRLRELNYKSGTIYFSGTKFINVVIFRIDNKNINELKKQFDRCALGSTITFENVTYYDEDDKIVLLDQVFKL